MGLVSFVSDRGHTEWALFFAPLVGDFLPGRFLDAGFAAGLRGTPFASARLHVGGLTALPTLSASHNYHRVRNHATGLVTV